MAGYNPWGALAGTSRSNATLTNYGYDGIQRPNAYYHDLGGTAADGLWTFARNPAGQIGSTTRTNDAYAWTGHYAVSRPYTTDGLNRYTTAGQPGPGQATFGYDLNGNLTSDGTRTFAYDIENRLVSASPNVALSYDPLGRLYEVSGTSGTTRFLYDGDALVAEYNTAGTMTRRYVHWTGADIPMLSYVDAGLTQLSQLHADERGSIIALTDAAGAATLNRYDEYGIPAPANNGRFQYTGQVWLNELGMYHYKGRVYSPYLGRFLQTDPVGYEDQINLYAYVGNDPVNSIDPTGECQETIGTDGTVTQTGICGRTAEEQGFIDARIADNTSEIGQLETRAVEEGQLIGFEFAGTAPDPRVPAGESDLVGGRTLITEYADGTRGIAVTIDPNDAVTVRGENLMGRTADRTLTIEEVAEHELASHARNAMEGRRASGSAAVGPDNRYRSRNHINFRRVSHDTDYVRTRQRRR